MQDSSDIGSASLNEDGLGAVVAPHQPVAKDTVFFGPLGLRAGWGIALYLLFAAVLAFVIGLVERTAMHQLHLTIGSRGAGSGDALSSVLAGEGTSAAAVCLAAFLMARVERRRVSVYGLQRSRLFDLLPGMLWGLACVALLIALLRMSHLLHFDARLLDLRGGFISGAGWLAACFLIGLFEECLMRGYIQYTLTRGAVRLHSPSWERARAIAFRRSALMMSLAFGLIHLFNARETVVGIFAAFLAGVVFCYALWRTGSLWWAIGFHTAWDWGQSFLFGVPDSGQLAAGRLFQTHPAGYPLLSGGVSGPEGSVFVIPVLLLVVAVIRFTTRPGPQPPLAPDGVLEPSPLASLNMTETWKGDTA